MGGVTKQQMKGMGLVEVSPGVWVPKDTKKSPASTKTTAWQDIKPPKENLLITFAVTPMGKPRMVKSDSWKKRPEVQNYWRYKDMIKNTAKGAKFVMPECNYWLVCYIPMAKSWTKKKKAVLDDQPHKQRPDKDNIEKGLLDALCEEDSHIWDGRVTKIWCYESEARMEVYKI